MIIFKPKTHQEKIMDRKIQMLKENFDIYGDGVAKLNIEKAKRNGYFDKYLSKLK